MSEAAPRIASDPTEMPARDWTRVLAQYRDPIPSRSVLELLVTLIPFLGLWCAALWSLSISVWLTLAITVPTSVFLLRLFLIQHDCGHGAYFRQRPVNDWLGRAIGVLTLTPYDVWKRSHSIHHASTGNLEKRGVGDINTLTIGEYQARGLFGKFTYRAYRHPFILFVVGPFYTFLLENRLPIGFMRAGWRYWISAMGTNLAITAVSGTLIYFVGLSSFLLVFLPTTMLAGAAGIWMFYVQHQFEETYWHENKDWDQPEAALYGSSYYDLPGILPWVTGNIGIHHVHHLYSRIPFYRLPHVIRDHPALADIHRLTLKDSLGCVKLQLWDENRRKLVSFSEARKSVAA